MLSPMTHPDDVETVQIGFNVDARRLREAGIDLDSGTRQRVKDLLLEALEFYVDCRADDAVEFELAIKDALVWLPED